MPASNATFGTFVDGGDIQTNDEVVGLRNGLNTRFTVTNIIGQFLPLTGGTMAGDINMAGNTITNVPVPSNSSDVVPKSYVDAITGGAALTEVDDTNVTLTLGGTPATALLHAVSMTLGWTGQLSLARGGTNANLTASNGGIFYSTATAGAILAGTATARQMLQSGASGAPAWSTATWPASTNINQILYSSSANVVGGITTGNNGVLITSAGGVPSISSTLPSAVQTNITALGAQSQALNMNSHLINNVLDPVSNLDAANKQYVDQTSLNGTSVYAASAASLGTVTQSGAGVGATLTNAGAQATFALDGVNPPAGSNVLIKNTATGMTSANEGIYTVTNVGSIITNWVLTRATDYDTATEINNTGLILVQNGSTLAGTAWYNAATIVTVDTTAFSYSQFGNIIFPVTLAQGGTGASLTASNGGIFYSTGSAGAILSGTATASKMLLSGSSAAPTWSTSTIPSSAGATANKVLLSDGTNYVLSTPTFPNASATSGKIIQSDGTNWVASTPTFPTVATSTGSFIYANGTNFVASTSLWPNTVGTAGKIIRSDGTTNAYTTSTFADIYSASNLLYSNGANTVTGLATANSAVLVTSSTGVPAWSGTMTNGQLIIGSTGATPTAATLTAGTGISITNAAGSITIAATGIPASAITQVIVQTFTSSGTYSPTSGMKYCTIECLGSGAGGGGTAGSTSTNSAQAGGGGAGSYARKTVAAATIGGSQTVTVGAAGTGGSAGNNAGNNGNDVSVGTICIGKGGTGGSGCDGTNPGAGGAGGIAGTGDFTPTGENGRMGQNSGASNVAGIYLGWGGNTMWGSGGSPTTAASAAGGNATGFGAGGGGATGLSGGGTKAGGNGSKGIVVITEYVSA
jgi:hypothetical protein